MKLFCIQFDCQHDYVEAASMPEAIAVWHAHRATADPEWHVPDTPEPESCALVHDHPVMRAERTATPEPGGPR